MVGAPERYLFALSSDDVERRKIGVTTIAKRYGFSATLLHEMQTGEDRLSWLSDRVEESAMAFFDVTRSAPENLLAFGMALESDAQVYALYDRFQHETPPLENLGEFRPRPYNGPAAFGAKVEELILEAQGVDRARHKRLIERIKNKIGARGQASMRELAIELGHRPHEIRGVVYSMVADRELEKVNENRWTTYRLPN